MQDPAALLQKGLGKKGLKGDRSIHTQILLLLKKGWVSCQGPLPCPPLNSETVGGLWGIMGLTTNTATISSTQGLPVVGGQLVR